MLKNSSGAQRPHEIATKRNVDSTKIVHQTLNFPNLIGTDNFVHKQDP